MSIIRSRSISREEAKYLRLRAHAPKAMRQLMLTFPAEQGGYVRRDGTRFFPTRGCPRN